VGLSSTSGSTYVVVGLGIVAIAALRDRPRAAFAVVIATTIYSSPVVLAGNLALFLAVAAPWAIDRATARPDGDTPRGAMWERLLARAPRSPG
jgi:hypothetical protein